jgi:N-acetylmuramoyl-L-alanine amidase
MKNMRAILILLFILIFSANTTFAYEIFLPKEKKTIMNTNYAFFIGKTNREVPITINDERVYIASNGAFSHSIKLKNGENRIIIKSDYKTQIYKIYKNYPEPYLEAKLEEFEPQTYIVKKDNTPLRSTPIDYGMNRISHLFEGTNLLINGSRGDFYRVMLSKTKEAWIQKSAVEKTSNSVNPKFITMNSETFKNASKHIIEFTEKLPYTIDETDSEIIFKVYNPNASEESVYTVNIKKPKKYTYNTNLHKGVYIFKVSELPKPEKRTLDGLTIVVDPGHGGSEKGAIGCLGDYEKDINLKIANELKNILCLMGANVIMTRECDGNIELDDRVKLAKKNASNIFISIHLNSIPDVKFDVHKNKGTSVYYYNKNSKRLAESVFDSVTNELNTRKDGVKTASFAVIRPTEYVGILIEVAYMTNPIDSVLYSKSEFPRETAKAIAEGILNFTTTEE